MPRVDGFEAIPQDPRVELDARGAFRSSPSQPCRCRRTWALSAGCDAYLPRQATVDPEALAPACRSCRCFTTLQHAVPGGRPQVQLKPDLPRACARIIRRDGRPGSRPRAPRSDSPSTCTLHRVEVEDRWTLAEVLRDHLRLTGTKIGWRPRRVRRLHACLLDGKPVYPCSQLAAWSRWQDDPDRRRAGSAASGQLDPLQRAFVEHDAPQCGFCTSGQLMAAKALAERQSASDRRRRARGDDRESVSVLELQPLRCKRCSRRTATTPAAVPGSDPDQTPIGAEIAPPASVRPRDAAYRRRRARQRQSHLYRRRAAAGDALCAQCCAARIPTRASAAIDVSKARALDGVKAVITHENCTLRLGRGL